MPQLRYQLRSKSHFIEDWDMERIEWYRSDHPEFKNSEIKIINRVMFDVVKIGEKYKIDPIYDMDKESVLKSIRQRVKEDYKNVFKCDLQLRADIGWLLDIIDQKIV